MRVEGLVRFRLDWYGGVRVFWMGVIFRGAAAWLVGVWRAGGLGGFCGCEGSTVMMTYYYLFLRRDDCSFGVLDREISQVGIGIFGEGDGGADW